MKRRLPHSTVTMRCRASCEMRIATGGTCWPYGGKSPSRCSHRYRARCACWTTLPFLSTGASRFQPSLSTTVWTRLLRLACASPSRTRAIVVPPQVDAAELLVLSADTLAEQLGIALHLHPRYQDDTPASQTVLAACAQGVDGGEGRARLAETDRTGGLQEEGKSSNP